VLWPEQFFDNKQKFIKPVFAAFFQQKRFLATVRKCWWNFQEYLYQSFSICNRNIPSIHLSDMQNVFYGQLHLPRWSNDHHIYPCQILQKALDVSISVETRLSEKSALWTLRVCIENICRSGRTKSRCASEYFAASHVRGHISLMGFGYKRRVWLFGTGCAADRSAV